jgi:hypothetical protein
MRGETVGCELVAGVDATTLLELVEELLDQVCCCRWLILISAAMMASCPLMAQSGSSALRTIRPLTGGNRTSARAALMSQNDPNRTFIRGQATPSVNGERRVENRERQKQMRKHAGYH